MRHLFNEEYESYTPEGIAFGDKIAEAVAPIIAEAQKSGVSMRDAETIALHEITVIIAEKVLRAATAKRRQLRATA